jgi:hypothetical protein
MRTPAAHLVVLAAVLAACGNAGSSPMPTAPSSSTTGEAAPPEPSAEEHITALDRASGSSYDALSHGDAAALVSLGEPALPALIDCFENDVRQTQISDDNWMQLGHLDVSTLCLRIVEWILDEPGLAYREAGDRHAAASALRAYVARYGAMSPVARRVAMLTDASTSDTTAGIAARWLTSADGPLDAVSSLDYIGDRMHVGPMRGASLRGDAQVDLVAAMVPRAARAMSVGHGHEACEIAASVVAWDASAEPQLLPTGRACLTAMCPCAYAFVALVAHADPAAAIRFLDEHGTTLLASDVFSRGRAVQIAAALDVPEVRRIVEARLTAMDLDVAVHDAVRTPPPPGLVVLLLVWSRAGLSAAHEALDHALDDADVLGTVGPDPGADGARVHMASAEYTLRLSEPITTIENVRARDLVTNALAMELGVPFSLGWPVARRDAVIAQIRGRLGPA